MNSPHANVREGSALHSRPVRQARSSASRNPCLTPPRGPRPPLGRPSGRAALSQTAPLIHRCGAQRKGWSHAIVCEGSALLRRPVCHSAGAGHRDAGATADALCLSALRIAVHHVGWVERSEAQQTMCQTGTLHVGLPSSAQPTPAASAQPTPHWGTPPARRAAPRAGAAPSGGSERSERGGP
ncbi:MAG: hypothetical protein FHP92_15280 [Denitromonas halophila]|nr:MAG: hypothetical protein FHP92_15280 [Denitromonas halophila]